MTHFTLYDRLCLDSSTWVQLTSVSSLLWPTNISLCLWIQLLYSFICRWTSSLLPCHIYIFLTSATCLTRLSDPASVPFVHAFSSAWNAFSSFLPSPSLPFRPECSQPYFCLSASNMGSYSVFVSQKLLSGFSSTCSHSTLSASVSTLLYNCPSVSASLTVNSLGKGLVLPILVFQHLA